MHYEDQSRRYTLLSGVLLGLVVGAGLAAAARPVSRLELRRRPPSRQERLMRHWGGLRGEADRLVGEALRSLGR